MVLKFSGPNVGMDPNLISLSSSPHILPYNSLTHWPLHHIGLLSLKNCHSSSLKDFKSHLLDSFLHSLWSLLFYLLASNICFLMNQWPVSFKLYLVFKIDCLHICLLPFIRSSLRSLKS